MSSTQNNSDEVEFPILCETCLGENPYVRMTREKLGNECKICKRAFTIFRWLPGRGMRYKKTEICSTCSKIKNVCQTCVLDLEHGLPVQVRDAALGIQNEVPREDSNQRDYMAKLANNLEVTGGNLALDYSGKTQPAGREMLRRMTRKDPYYKRNRAHICSFFVKGMCNRGNECPYRHEMPDGDEDLAKQNIVDRYHGTNDPVAKRMLAKKMTKADKLSPPEDKSITSLFVAGMDTSIAKDDLQEHFGVFGEIKSVIVVPRGDCAFVNFKTRANAEAAAEAALSGCAIKDKSLKIMWGKPKPKGPKSELQNNTKSPGDRKRVPPPPPGALDSSNAALYPSQDPTALGASK